MLHEPLEVVKRTSDSPAALVQDVRTNHRRPDIAVAEQFLDRPDVVAASSKCVAKEWRKLWQLARFVTPARSTASSTARCRTDYPNAGGECQSISLAVIFPHRRRLSGATARSRSTSDRSTSGSETVLADNLYSRRTRPVGIAATAAIPTTLDAATCAPASIVRNVDFRSSGAFDVKSRADKEQTMGVSAITFHDWGSSSATPPR